MNNKYDDFIISGNLDELSNIFFTGDLVKYQYKGKYLIEYLLECGIHSKKMDEYLKYHDEFVKFYLKYDIIKPLLYCSLNVLLKKYDDENLVMDIVLDRLNDGEKIVLYHNFKVDSYNRFHDMEEEIRKIYLRHGIILPKVFVSNDLNQKEITVSKEDEKILNEVRKVFSNQDYIIIDVMINELKRNLVMNHQRAVNDINKILLHKKNNLDFKIIDSETNDGAYDSALQYLQISRNTESIFNHELSHLLYQNYEDDSIIPEYQKLRSKVNDLDRIKNYLILFHSEYDDLLEYYEKKYYKMVEEKYGSFDNYIKIVCEDILKNKPEFLSLWYEEEGLASLESVNDDNVEDIITEFLQIEKKEYINGNVRHDLASKLMLENLLDAILLGKIFDEELGINCLSGHGSLYFMNNEVASFDEALADFDAIVKSSDKDDIEEDLRYLVGDELVDFLYKYLRINRENSYGNR